MPFRRLLRPLIPRHWRPLELAKRRVLERSNLVVQAGPYAGLHYPQPGLRDWFFPQLLGAYERELVPALEPLLASAPVERIVVAGAAEGYYAVGLARQFPHARVVAFESEPSRRARLAAVAASNGVTIDVRGLCDLSTLARELDGPSSTVLLVDIEGGEAMLLDPAMIPALRRVRMLVEVHDFFVPETGELLARRFADSHRIERIDARRRGPGDLPALALPQRRLLERYYISLLDEKRPAGSYWLLFEPGRTAP